MLTREEIIQKLEETRKLANGTPLHQKLSVWELEINWLLDKELKN